MTADHAARDVTAGAGAGTGPLDDVREAADAALEAQAAGATDSSAVARLTVAAKAALDAGYGLAAVAGAEAAGQEAARSRLRTEVLRDVARSAKKKREATAEHDAAVGRAASLGLRAREIAERAGVAHGTVAAIVRRQQSVEPAARPPLEVGVGGAGCGRPVGRP